LRLLLELMQPFVDFLRLKADAPSDADARKRDALSLAILSASKLVDFPFADLKAFTQLCDCQ